jgi:transketolase
VREHAMGAMLNGMALHGGFLPYGGTFLVFADYLRPSIRVAALSKLPVIYVFTHDSIYVGEDGPTHQPVEHLASLRCIPNLAVIRPADARETAQAWRVALERRTGPTALILSRQGLPVIDSGDGAAKGVEQGAYCVKKAAGNEIDLLLVATGSEVHLALGAAEVLEKEGRKVQVVSMPCWEFFSAQPRAYQDEVLPPRCRKRLVVEAGVTFGWERYAGDEGRVLGMDRFGASAPGKVLGEKFGFTVDHVLEAARSRLG